MNRLIQILEKENKDTPAAPREKLRDRILGNLYEYCVKELTKGVEPVLLDMIEHLKRRVVSFL